MHFNKASVYAIICFIESLECRYNHNHSHLEKFWICFSLWSLDDLNPKIIHKKWQSTQNRKTNLQILLCMLTWGEGTHRAWNLNRGKAGLHTGINRGQTKVCVSREGRCPRLWKAKKVTWQGWTDMYTNYVSLVRVICCHNIKKATVYYCSSI